MRYFYYALWSAAALIVAGVVFFFLFFVHYERTPYLERMQNAARRSNADRTERERREYQAKELARNQRYTAYVEEVVSLTSQVESKWRTDVDTATLTAKPGVVPPMLDIEESASFVTVTNKLDDQAVCVSLNRVARRSSRANDYDRCRLDLDTCRELLPHASFRFREYRTGNPPACAKAAIEFRVGTPLQPEPTWWSRSALEAFDARPPAEPLRTQSQELWPLGGNVNALKALLAENERAVRWRREFGSRVGVDKVEAD